MKKLRYVPLLILFVITSTWSFAQPDQIYQLIKGSKEDANYLVGGYVAPMLNVLGNGLNQGWYNTAKPHKLVGFDLTVNISPVYVPTSDYTYKVDNAKLANLNHVDGTDKITPTTADVPTIFGSSNAPTYNAKINGQAVPTPLTSFSGPPGLDLKGKYGVKALPIPTANLSIGLPAGFDIKFRYVPTLDLGEQGKFGLLGIGLMHDIKQYIPGIKSLPFDLSVFAGYTKMTTDITFDASKNQTGKFDVTATTLQALISKKIAVLTIYGGVGYNMAKSNFKAQGTYDLGNSVSITDPVDISASSSGPRMTAAARLRLAVFAFSADYTLQKY